MKIFITGGTGFLGKYVASRLLKDGHTLLLLTREPAVGVAESMVEKKWKRKIAFLRGDLVELEKYQARIKRFRPEVVIHLAWEGIPSDQADLDLRNFENGIRVIRAGIAAGAKAFVMAGSCHEYGEPGVEVSEQSPLRPFNAFYATKVALQWLGSKLAAEHGVAFIWLRPGFIYGPGQRRKALMPYLVDTLKRGEEPMLRTPNGGNDYIYVGDVADAIAKAVNRYKKIGTNVYNISAGRLVSVMEVVQNVYREFGLPLPRQFKKTPRTVGGVWMDVAKAKKELGWEPHMALRAGIKKTVAYFKTN